jgi:hypothetical protein
MFTQGYGTLDQFTSNCVQEYQIPVKKIAENVELSNIHYGAEPRALAPGDPGTII